MELKEISDKKLDRRIKRSFQMKVETAKNLLHKSYPDSRIIDFDLVKKVMTVKYKDGTKEVIRMKSGLLADLFLKKIHGMIGESFKNYFVRLDYEKGENLIVGFNSKDDKEVHKI